MRQHGVGKRHTGRKIHLDVEETTQNVIGIEVIATAWGDGEILPGQLDQIVSDIAQVAVDGVYEGHSCHAACAERDARATIPARDGAVTWGGGHTRNVTLRKLGPRRSTAGTTRTATTGAALPKKQCTGSSLWESTCPPEVWSDKRTKPTFGRP